MYLILEYMDGEEETVYFADSSTLRVEMDQVVIRHGNRGLSQGSGNRDAGSYLQRGKVQGYPLGNVRRWRTSEHERTS